MDKTYYIGSFRQDALNGPNHGWIVGKFKDNLPQKTNDLEIKYWECPTGHAIKISATIECTLILKGKTKATINGHTTVLNPGDYVVIAPGTPNNLVTNVYEDIAGLTIKAPSDPSAKTTL